jgi:hypothetical protein
MEGNALIDRALGGWSTTLTLGLFQDCPSSRSYSLADRLHLAESSTTAGPVAFGPEGEFNEDHQDAGNLAAPVSLGLFAAVFA